MKISVLQWNVLYLQNVHNIATYLKANPADIICLQELTVNHPDQPEPDTPEYIAAQLGYQHYTIGSQFKMEGQDDVKIVDGIFSRFPITHKRSVWINEPIGTGGYDDEYRPYIEIKVDVEGTALTIATTHMSYTDRFEVTDRKSEESDKLIIELRKNKEKYVFTGDLNVTPDSYTIQEISKVLNHAGPEYSQKTWTTKPFSYRGFEEKELNWRLDYVFASKDIKVSSSEIETTEFSDHLPVRTEFEI